jgi:hypothetical protein
MEIQVTMESGFMNLHLRRIGLSVFAALLLSSAAVAQDVVVDDGDAVYIEDPVVMYPIDPIVEVDPIPEDGSSDEGTVDDGTDDGSSDEGTVDDVTYVDVIDEKWPTEDDLILVICDGFCIGPDCFLGEGLGPWEYEEVLYTLDGVRPEDCPECRNLTLDTPVEIYQMSSGGPEVTDVETEIAAKPRQSRVASVTPSSAAECLALYPQLPWLCEWQNTSGQ